MQTALRISASPALVGARAPARKAAPSAVREKKNVFDNSRLFRFLGVDKSAFGDGES